MSDRETLAEARRWLRFAFEDLRAAHALLQDTDARPRHACWLAQQAAEKALKAALVHDQVPFPFRHDLDALRNLLPNGWSIKSTEPDLATLTEWAVESRYPGDWPEATTVDAERAVEQARAVCESIEADLISRDIPDGS